VDRREKVGKPSCYWKKKETRPDRHFLSEGRGGRHSLTLRYPGKGVRLKPGRERAYGPIRRKKEGGIIPSAPEKKNGILHGGKSRFWLSQVQKEKKKVGRMEISANRRKKERKEGGTT